MQQVDVNAVLDELKISIGDLTVQLAASNVALQKALADLQRANEENANLKRTKASKSDL